jgi:hypothetical protein
MGRLLVILLVMLIPLHGWSAERMAVQMAYSQTILAAVGEQAPFAKMPADCPMVAQAASKAEKDPSPPKGFGACQTCQLCMTLASSSFPQTEAAAHLTTEHPECARASFISADVAPQIKPPIL